jgi:hypothetical protein
MADHEAAGRPPTPSWLPANSTIEQLHFDLCGSGEEASLLSTREAGQ